MSLYDYTESLYIIVQDRSFNSLVMAAMRKADTDNLERLQHAFPQIWMEFRERYNAPGGKIEGD